LFESKIRVSGEKQEMRFVAFSTQLTVIMTQLNEDIAFLDFPLNLHDKFQFRRKPE